MTPAQYNEYQRQADVIEQTKRWEEERIIKKAHNNIARIKGIEYSPTSNEIQIEIDNIKLKSRQ
jgi:hypothetical protein